MRTPLQIVMVQRFVEHLSNYSDFVSSQASIQLAFTFYTANDNKLGGGLGMRLNNKRLNHFVIFKGHAVATPSNLACLH